MFDAFRKTAVLTAAFAAALLCSCIKSDGSTHVECPSAAAPAPNETPRGISSVDGVWLMLDKDADNEPESVIVVYERGGLRFAKMVAIYHNGKIDDTIEKPLERAKGLAGNPPICGLDFVWNLKPSDGGKYVGKVVNPDDGGVYRCKLWVDVPSQRLVLRGELFVFGESEYLVPFDAAKLPFKLDISKLSPVLPKSE